MRGLLQHFKLTLLLNCRSRQALIYGYLVPILFLIAFGSIFRNAQPPLLRQLGQLLTISVLGGACFGMPTAMVAERERGIWRRYRLLPARTGALIISTMAARVVIVLSAAVLQVFLAWLMYGMPMPAHPVQMAGAFLVVTFGFLGMGLIIAMLAGNVPAVQALGQAIFLPMIMIGGVGVPLWTLPAWAQRLAGYLPGKYAVEALQSCASGAGLGPVWFDLVALAVIGASACAAGAMMFRWDAQEKADSRKRGWIVLALAAWIAVGVTTDFMGRPNLLADRDGGISGSDGTGYLAITQQQIDAVKYEELSADNDLTNPVAMNLLGLDKEGKDRMAAFRKALDAWPPGQDKDAVRRVRNLLDAASVADIVQNRYEAAIAYIVFDKLREDIPASELEKILTWIILHPNDETPVLAIPKLGVDDSARAVTVNERAEVYATKLLGRLTGKIVELH